MQYPRCTRSAKYDLRDATPIACQAHKRAGQFTYHADNFSMPLGTGMVSDRLCCSHLIVVVVHVAVLLFMEGAAPISLDTSPA